MSLALTVRERTLRQRLFSERPEDWVWVPGVRRSHTFFERRWKLFQPVALLGLALGALVAVATFWRWAAVGTLSLATLAWVMRARAKRSAECLEMEWDAPTAVPERGSVNLTLTLKNRGALPIHAVGATVAFEGTEGPRARVRVDEVPAGDETKVQVQFKADGGMGSHWAGPWTLEISDPLGLWEFEATDGRRKRIDVLPEPLVGGPEELPPSLDSVQPGENESPRLGDSQVFAGLREYRAGDSIRRIHWRRSVRVGELLVKEFERAISTEVTLFLDMDGRRHAGRGARSTWECAKDFAAALVRSLCARGVRVRVVSQGLTTAFGTGRSHEDALLKGIAQLRPARVEGDPALTAEIPYGSSVFWVTPAQGGDDATVTRQLASLRASGSQVTAILISVGGFLEGEEPIRALGASVIQVQRESTRALARWSGALVRASVECVVLEKGQSPAKVWEGLQ
ncbi:MAG TPA: DUF58 domain-containing protein [Bdellovibrionota bacterium]|nr:DUF58 domain-containing protein [Bdellovibrionota bacterium]